MNCPQSVMDHRNVLECKKSSGKNAILSDRPTPEDLFIGIMEDQFYISRILKENLELLKARMTM